MFVCGTGAIVALPNITNGFYWGSNPMTSCLLGKRSITLTLQLLSFSHMYRNFFIIDDNAL